MWPLIFPFQKQLTHHELMNCCCCISSITVCISFNFFNCYLLSFILFSFLQLQLKLFNFFNYYNNFIFIFISSITTCSFFSSIAIAFLLLLCCTVFYLGVGFFAFSSTWKIWFPHIQKKGSMWKKIWLYSSDFKKEFFRQISITGSLAGSKKIKRIHKIFYFHNNMVGL